MLHVKLTVYYTVSFTCNIHFLNSTYFIFNQFKINKFGVSFAAGYIYQYNGTLLKEYVEIINLGSFGTTLVRVYLLSGGCFVLHKLILLIYLYHSTNACD